MRDTESRRSFVKKGAAAAAGLLGVSHFSVTPVEAARKKPEPLRYVGDRIVVEKTEKIYSAPVGAPLKYCGWTDIAFWRGKYYLDFSRKNRHIARPPDGPGLIVLSSTDLENWSEQVLPDFSQLHGGERKGDDRDAKLFSTPDRLFALNTPYPFDTYISYTEDGANWTKWRQVYPDGPRAQSWRPKEHNGAYYMACDYNNDRVDLIKSKDMLNWQYVSTIMSGAKHQHTNAPTETELVFLDDGRCIAFTRLNEVETLTHPENTLPGFSIARPPYTSWEFALGTAVRFGGPAVHRFGDTVLVIARGELGKGRGYWNFEVDPNWKGTHRTGIYTFDVERMRLEQQALLPTEYAHDSSYAGILPTGENTALVSWYDGDTTSESDIWLAHIRIT